MELLDLEHLSRHSLRDDIVTRNVRLSRTGRLGHIALYSPAKLRNGPVDPREALAAAASARGDSLATLSRMRDRRSSYLSDFVRDGVPRALTERDHGLLTAYFGQPIGIRDLWANELSISRVKTPSQG